MGVVLSVVLLAVLPNALFLALAPWFMVRRAVAPLLYVLAAIPSLFLPRAFTYLFFLAAAAADAFFVVSFTFDMPFDASLGALRYLADIDFAASALYIGCIAYFFASAILLAYLLNRYRATIRQVSLLPALAVAALAGWLDFSFNGYKPIALPQFESAMQQSGVTARSIIEGKRDVLFVLVEGLGAYARPQEREMLEGILANAAGGRFTITHGLSNYHGSTTGAESRELCGKWATFVDFLASNDHHCLPAALASAGIETISYHAGNGDLFSRYDWYPRIGIARSNFRQEIAALHPGIGARTCGSVTIGLCDDDVGALVHKELLRPSENRKFVYWLTLNSHLPYEPVSNGPLHCDEANAAIPERVPCQLTEIWMGVFDSIASIMADPSVPPVDIVIAGDHNTPIWRRSAFGYFVSDKVDWYHLRYNAEAEQVVSSVVEPAGDRLSSPLP